MYVLTQGGVAVNLDHVERLWVEPNDGNYVLVARTVSQVDVQLSTHDDREEARARLIQIATLGGPDRSEPAPSENVVLVRQGLHFGEKQTRGGG
jgi:hypothetical protein